MDLFSALPALRRHPLLENKRIALIGVSTIVHDGTAHYFEVCKQKYWSRRKDGTTGVGIGGIGGGIEKGETIAACLHREAEEEIGTRVRIERPDETCLIHDWQIVDTLSLKPSKKRPTPLIVLLVPPRLGGPETPDHLAIVSFRTRLRGEPAPRDLFGLLRVENAMLADFFSRDEWPLEEALALAGLTLTLNGELPSNTILRPTLTGRAFQLLVRKGHP